LRYTVIGGRSPIIKIRSPICIIEVDDGKNQNMDGEQDHGVEYQKDILKSI